jgi:hypothetical protein
MTGMENKEYGLNLLPCQKLQKEKELINKTN